MVLIKVHSFAIPMGFHRFNLIKNLLPVHNGMETIQFKFNLSAPELIILILAHPVYKM